MAAVHQLLQMEMNWWYTREGLDRPSRGGLEGSEDPEARLSLHLPEVFQGAFIARPFEVPETCPIGCDRENAGPVKESLVVWPQSSDRVAKGWEGSHGRECLPGVLSDVVLKSQRPVEKETQVSPVLLGCEGGAPRERGVSQVNRGVLSPTSGEVEGLRLLKPVKSKYY